MDIVSQLRRDEGEVLHVYLDSLGIRTAGVGHNLESHGINLPVGSPITQAQSDDWLRFDIEQVKSDLAHHLPWTSQLEEVRRAVLWNMSFNMGVYGVMKFKNTLALIHSGDYLKAADAMLQSTWAQQVGPRADRLARQMLTGTWI
jgi:lysozyme